MLFRSGGKPPPLPLSSPFLLMPMCTFAGDRSRRILLRKNLLFCHFFVAGGHRRPPVWPPLAVGTSPLLPMVVPRRLRRRPATHRGDLTVPCFSPKQAHGRRRKEEEEEGKEKEKEKKKKEKKKKEKKKKKKKRKRKRKRKKKERKKIK